MDIIIQGLKFTHKSIQFMGGEHSGHHGHAGRPGSVGGSAPSGSVPSASPGTLASWYKPPKLNEGLVDSLGSMDIGDASYAAEQLGYDVEWNAYNKDVQRWNMQADRDAKYEIEGWLQTHPEVRALSLYSDWSASYTKDAIAGKEYPGFKDWLDTPQILYRSGGRSEVFMSFARSKRVAMDATNTNEAWWISASPRQWFASAGTGAGEVWLASDAVETLGENY